MSVRAVTIFSAASRMVLVLLAVQISIESTLRYITHAHAGPEPVVTNAFATPFLFLHVVGAMTALLIGPLQFVIRLRDRWPYLHRAIGWTYILGCLVGAPTGFVLALGTTAGPVAGSGFAMAALLWPLFTGLALRAALARRFDDHRNWMLRSYAIVAGAITLRLMLPAALFSGYDFYPAYRLIAWLTWTTNMAVCEIIIHRTRRPAKTPAPATAS